ncbi:MAG: AbrB/MazE/SpoVT family DNA-binding domain-containing protein [Firmicutes bacterium]|nr:AbrB/MazE/SpoVT family DNA-binding domain-containing protein [Candidatus Fermentithermobacillaceae bacterium]
MYKSSLSLRGQITVPKPLRDKFRLKPGDEVLINEVGGRIVLTPKLSDPVSQGRGFLAKRLPGLASRYNDELNDEMEEAEGGAPLDKDNPGPASRRDEEVTG